MQTPLTLEWLPGRYAVCRLASSDAIPSWASLAASGDAAARFISITRTDQELSIVCDESLVPSNVTAQRGFVAMRIVGQVDMATIGIFARLTTALASATVPVFVLSTYDTDYLMVRAEYAHHAADALLAAGCPIVGSVP